MEDDGLVPFAPRQGILVRICCLWSERSAIIKVDLASVCSLEAARIVGRRTSLLVIRLVEVGGLGHFGQGKVCTFLKYSCDLLRGNGLWVLRPDRSTDNSPHSSRLKLRLHSADQIDSPFVRKVPTSRRDDWMRDLYWRHLHGPVIMDETLRGAARNRVVHSYGSRIIH